VNQIADPETALIEDIAGFQHDPLGYVLYAFPWGEGELVGHLGPRMWQREILVTMGEKLKAGRDLGCVIQEAIASGHGIGKSALVAWIVLWALSTFEDTKAVVTANTEPQLRTKTWPELLKWHRLAINSHWFEPNAMSLHAKSPGHEKTWRADALPWSEHNPEAFAGLHNQGRRILLVFDEASAISDRIYEVAEGALTDEKTEIIWLCFGNPTRNTGRFRECFGRFAHRWGHKQIDSRTVEGTNRAQLDKLVADYGEDHDIVRVRIKGQFPRAGSMQFISSEYADAARKREPNPTMYDPRIVGVDVARYGDDESVIYLRHGNDAKTTPPVRLRGVDTMTLAGKVAEFAQRNRVDMIFVDETGVGAGVVDRLRQLNCKVIGVNNGSSPDNQAVGDEKVANKGAECWAKMRLWLKETGSIDDSTDLQGQLEGREYGYNSNNEIVLERKDDMKKRGLASPDLADALALTFAYPVLSLTREQALQPAGYGDGVVRMVRAPNPFED